MNWFKKRNSRPAAPEVASRLLVLKHVVTYAVITPPRDMLGQLMSSWSAEERDSFARQAVGDCSSFWRGLRNAGLWQSVSPREKAFAQTTIITMTEQQQIEASWRMEAVYVLMWALNMLPVIGPYDQSTSHDLLK